MTQLNYSGSLYISSRFCLPQSSSDSADSTPRRRPMLRAVSKFGGSSVADAACVSRVVSLIKAPPADRTRQHVVVSAPGKRTLPGGAADIKVTDLLLKAHGLAAAKSRAEYDATMSTIAARFMELCPGLASLQAGLDAAARFLRHPHRLPHPHHRLHHRLSHQPLPHHLRRRRQGHLRPRRARHRLRGEPRRVPQRPNTLTLHLPLALNLSPSTTPALTLTRRVPERPGRGARDRHGVRQPG